MEIQAKVFIMFIVYMFYMLVIVDLCVNINVFILTSCFSFNNIIIK